MEVQILIPHLHLKVLLLNALLNMFLWLLQCLTKLWTLKVLLMSWKTLTEHLK